MGWSTPIKTLVKSSDCHCQPLTSTPKLKPKLLVAAQHHRVELAAKQKGAPHGTHVKSTPQQKLELSLQVQNFTAGSKTQSPVISGIPVSLVSRSTASSLRPR